MTKVRDAVFVWLTPPSEKDSVTVRATTTVEGVGDTVAGARHETVAPEPLNAPGPLQA